MLLKVFRSGETGPEAPIDKQSSMQRPEGRCSLRFLSIGLHWLIARFQANFPGAYPHPLFCTWIPLVQ